jgi:hypothetical protein
MVLVGRQSGYAIFEVEKRSHDATANRGSALALDSIHYRRGYELVYK